MPIVNGNIFIEQIANNGAVLNDYCGKSRLAIVTEPVIFEQHWPILSPNFANFDYSLLSLAVNEQQKQWPAVAKILTHLTDHNHDRHSTLLCLSGGVLGDLAGFAAAIFMRGMRWIQMPTTLLAQVDAAIGGKTGGNFLGIKNLMGAFHSPQAIFIDPTLLRTLPTREFNAGLAEVVKYGFALDAEFFVWLEQHTRQIKQREPIVLQAMITRCCEIKSAIAAIDSLDNGPRQLLNFGHTFAHALEAATEFNYYLHGEAVAIGMLLATHLAVKLKLVDSGLFTRLQDLLTGLDLNMQYNPEICSVKMLFDYMSHDKKKHSQTLRLVLPCALGEVRALDYIDIGYLKGLMDDYGT